MSENEVRNKFDVISRLLSDPELPEPLRDELTEAKSILADRLETEFSSLESEPG